MRVQERTSELKRSNDQLELEVGERKRAEAVLTLRSQDLARSNAELDAFAYMVSHLTFHTLFYAIFMNFHLFHGEIKVL
jgi:C4-dicarboxylate-specific signal transduction histidine kinase